MDKEFIPFVKDFISIKTLRQPPNIIIQNEISDDSKQTGNDKNSENENIVDRQTKSESSVQSGNPDERGHEAEEVQIQNGDKDVNDSEKIRARVQKFRDIPEDNGGLLRALIAKEYSKNRYRDK